MTRLRLVPPPAPHRPMAPPTCAVCEVSLRGRPFHHRQCLTCWRWIRLASALRSARKWLAGEPRGARR